METLRVGFIGVGLPRGSADASGMGMAYEHAAGFAAAGGCALAAAADIHAGNAAAFAARHPGVRTYGDHRAMLEKERLDAVSVCVWTALHHRMVMDCLAAGVRAIHCEKPMAATFGEAREMAEAAGRAGVQLTFHHQRRFNPAVERATELLSSGAIGPLVRMEAATPNLFDRGTHFADLLFAFNGQATAQWVLGQIHAGEAREIFGIRHESQGVALARFENGVSALIVSGEGVEPAGPKIRLTGERGAIEIGCAPGPVIRDARWRRDDRAGWEAESFDTGVASEEMSARAIAEIIGALREGRPSALDARHALQAAELTFAVYESARRRGRVDLPLAIDDSPLEALLGGD